MYKLQALAFFPWLIIDEKVEIGNFILEPFSDNCQNIVDSFMKILKNNMDYTNIYLKINKNFYLISS